MIVLLLPWVILLAYFGGVLFVLGIPQRLVSSYPPEEIGHAASALEVMFTSNLVLALFCIVAGLSVIVIAFAWLRAALYRNRGDSGWITAYIVVCAIIMVAASGATSYNIVVNNELYEHIANSRTDKLMLDGDAYESYTGVAYIRGTAALEGDAGQYFRNQDDWYYDLRILENGTNWITVYLPIGLAEERGIDKISANEPYDEVTVQYLPNTYVVSEVWRAGREPALVSEPED